jgi:hypothetical protein
MLLKSSLQNVPIICTLCKRPDGRYPTYPAVWRYNMPQHLPEMHLEYASPNSPEGQLLPFDVWASMRLDPGEEREARIPVQSCSRPAECPIRPDSITSRKGYRWRCMQKYQFFLNCTFTSGWLHTLDAHGRCRILPRSASINRPTLRISDHPNLRHVLFKSFRTVDCVHWMHCSIYGN